MKVHLNKVVMYILTLIFSSPPAKLEHLVPSLLLMDDAL